VGVNTPLIPSRTIGLLHNSALLPHVECYVALLREQGYAANTIAQHVYSFCSFHRWLKRRRGNLRELNERIVDEFMKNRKHDSHDGAPQAFRRLLVILRSAGVTPPAKSPSCTPAQRIVGEYRDYLRVERSFAPKTVVSVRRSASEQRLDSLVTVIATRRPGAYQ